MVPPACRMAQPASPAASVSSLHPSSVPSLARTTSIRAWRAGGKSHGSGPSPVWASICSSGLCSALSLIHISEPTRLDVI
eukprot:5907259-Prorocentrum_lima.AAC.1